MCRYLFAFALAFGVFFFEVAPALAKKYRVIPLEQDESLFQMASSINNSGVVAGALKPSQYSETLGAVFDLFENQYMVGAFPDVFSRILGINQKNQATGYRIFKPSTQIVLEPFAMDFQVSPDPIPLQPLSKGGAAFTSDINNQGLVVGTATDEAGRSSGVIWNINTPEKPPVNLGILPTFEQSSARAINEAGDVVGVLMRSIGARAYILKNAKMELLPVTKKLGDSSVNDINEAGIAVGNIYESGAIPLEAVFWKNGNLKKLSKLPGYYYSSAHGLNNYNQIVGVVRKESNFSASEGVIWEKGVIENLNDLLHEDSQDWTIRRAIAINDAEQIVALATKGEGVKSVVLVRNKKTLLNGFVTDSGQVQLKVDQAWPSQVVHFYVSEKKFGGTPIDGCSDKSLEIGNGQHFHSAKVDSQGKLSVQVSLPKDLLGKMISFEAYQADEGTCKVSNRVLTVTSGAEL